MKMDEIHIAIGDAVTKMNKIVAVAKSASDAYPDDKDRMVDLLDVVIDYSTSLSKDLDSLYEKMCD